MKYKSILITGGAGFIGSHVTRLFVNKYPQYQIFNLDALTYAGNLENLSDIESAENYTFIKGDITDESFVNALFEKHKFSSVIHLAAESHVDRSIEDPLSFVKTNVIGTMILLNAFKSLWKDDFTASGQNRHAFHKVKPPISIGLGVELGIQSVKPHQLHNRLRIQTLYR